MVNPELETPKTSEKPPFKFPPYRRRRPLKSQTFSTFIRILSECHLQLYKPEQVATIQGDQLVVNNDSTIQGNHSIATNNLRPEDGLSPEKLLVNEHREIVSSKDQGFTGDHMDIDGLDSVDNVKSNGDQEHVDNINVVESVEEGNRINNNDFAAFASLIDNDDRFSLPDFDMEGFGFEEQSGEKAPCVDVSGLIGSLLETDVTVGASHPVHNKEEKSSPVEGDNTEMQMKSRESDTPLPAPVMVSSSLQKSTAYIEDGDILENSAVLEKSSALLLEDVVSLEKNSVNQGQVSGDFIQKEGFSWNALQRGFEKENQSNSLSRNGMSTAIDVQMGNDNINLGENRSKLVYYGDIVEDDRSEGHDGKHQFGRNRQRCGPKEANSPSLCPKNLTLSAGSTGESTIENQCSASTEKKKERMKRAEKDRKLGVKRLKLQSVSKPKTVAYCRRFLKGRCHEGKKCKFSHDTIPLTKSKACSHFTRQSCMKGDVCSYNHQLSKYPCNNYLSKGSCSRGSNCMFSHDVVPVKEGSSITLDICKPELQSVSVKETSNLKKQMTPYATRKQIDSAKLCSSGISLCKNGKDNEEGTTLKPVEQAPKGINFVSHGKVPVGNLSKHGQVALSPKADNGAKADEQRINGALDVVFLSHGKVPVGNMSKHGQVALSPKADNGAKADQQRINGALDVVESLNKNTQRTTAAPPRGVNFLSFGKTPFESSSSKKSSFSSISNLEIGKSLPSDPGKSEQTGSSSKTDGGVKVDSQTGRGASSIFKNLNETANTTPAMTPRGLSFLSVGDHLDSSITKKQVGSHLNEINAVQPTDKKNVSVNNKLQSPSPVLPQVSSSSVPRDLSLGKLTDAQSKSSLSASQRSLLSNTPSSVPKVLCSTIAFASKIESETKKDRLYGAPAVSTDLSKEASSSRNKSMKASTILDFLYGANSKSKQ